jgi:predicted ester cyclase
LTYYEVGVYSPAPKVGRRTVSEENKALVRRLMEAINEGDLDVVDELFSPKLAGPMKRSFVAFHTAFPDWSMEIGELVAEGDTVVGRFRCSGTNQGEFKGAPPTGKRMEVDEVYFLRVEHRKFVYFWGLEDELARLRQLGLLPSPE